MDYNEIITELEEDKELVWYDDDMWAIGYNDGLNYAISVIRAKLCAGGGETPNERDKQQ